VTRTTKGQIIGLLTGEYGRVGLAFNSIGRVVAVELVAAAAASITIKSQMLDTGEREEVGQIIIGNGTSVSSTERYRDFIETDRPFSLSRIITSEPGIGPVISGLVFSDICGRQLEIICAAEIYTLFVRCGYLESMGERELHDQDYEYVDVV
jgi:hypothetical protein